MSQIEKEFLAEECGECESKVYNSYPIEDDRPIEFYSHFGQKILDRTKIRTARKCDKSGDFIIAGERFRAEFEIAMTIPAFISLFDSGFYTPEQFGFVSRHEMQFFYHSHFKDDGLVFVHKIID